MTCKLENIWEDQKAKCYISQASYMIVLSSHKYKPLFFFNFSLLKKKKDNEMYDVERPSHMEEACLPVCNETKVLLILL